MCLIIALYFFSFGTFLGFVFRDVIPVPFQLAGSKVLIELLGPCHFLVQGVALGSASVPLAPLTTLLLFCIGPWVDSCSDPVPLADVDEHDCFTSHRALGGSM
jgi:hypothetical protein